MNALLSQLRLDAELKALIETISPADRARLEQDAFKSFMRGGGFVRGNLLPYLPALVHDWEPGDTGGKYVPQVSNIERLVAHATTPPSAGNCTVTLSVVTPGSGSTPIGTVTILRYQVSGETGLDYDVPAGSWLFASVTNTNGASGVSIAVVRRLR